MSIPEPIPAQTLPEKQEPAAKPDSARIRLDYLDGLRGLAALYVVLFHVRSVLTYHGEDALPDIARLGSLWMKFGRYAVAVFIVLSGYCLMLPVARSADGMLRGGFGDYIKRRARRILPPYYAALVLSLLVIALVPGMNQKQHLAWDTVLPAFTPGNLVSHLTLFHNVSPEWADKINGSLWSVATEWQIYFIFPALLLPLWRKSGLTAVVLVGFALGLAPRFLIPGGRMLDGAAPWFLGLFGMGMAGAVVGFRETPGLRAWRTRVPWGALAALCFGVFGAVALAKSAWLYFDYLWGWDIVVGAGATCLLIYCTRFLTDRPEASRPDVLYLLESRAAVSLGTFSYSLYLMHAPILGLAHRALVSLSLSPLALFCAMLFGGVPLCLLGSYLFHLAFERRFMSPVARPVKKLVEARSEAERAASY